VSRAGGAAALGGLMLIAALTFGGRELDQAKLGILLASLIAGVVGWSTLRRAFANTGAEASEPPAGGSDA
jgi:Na+/H+ antiporter NhaA